MSTGRHPLLHSLFRTSRVGARSASFHSLHGGPRRRSTAVHVNFHAYADDNQLYLHCRRDDMLSAVERLERCLTAVSHWMARNRVKLNAEKTELFWAGWRYSAAVLGNNGPSLKLGQDTVSPSNRVRVLGVTFSSDLSLDEHVARVSATYFY